jgi:uracil-DNA glycosylase family 4
LAEGGIMGFPKACDICIKQKVNADLFSGDIEFDVKPFRGAKLSVMLVGQDPTVVKRKIVSVLDLENSYGLLYRYINEEILTPVGLGIENIYATDLIKCRFPDNQTPRKISDKCKITMTEFLHPFFLNCKKWFFEEVQEIQPKLILSFGEPVHQLLIEEFGWHIPIRMKYAFGEVYPVRISGMKLFYTPSVHLNTKGKQHYQNLWNKFLDNLRKARVSAGIS